jgi:VIT1/CCC1 family predicted Fe2+/Mn2+ transporter
MYMPKYKNVTYELPSDTIENGKLNKLRAAVLGANDGIVSVSALVMGVAGATTADPKAVAIGGMAALIAGALSMAVGEYVSVSSQSDAEKAYIDLEKKALRDMPGLELHELAHEYMKHGVSEKTAKQVAKELTDKDALRAHLRMHFNLDPDDINNPWQAAIASLLAFTAGGLVPFLAMTLSPNESRVLWTLIAVVIALTVTGYVSAVVAKASRTRAILRVLIGGIVAMGITYAVGVVFGTNII